MYTYFYIKILLSFSLWYTVRRLKYHTLLRSKFEICNQKKRWQASGLQDTSFWPHYSIKLDLIQANYLINISFVKNFKILFRAAFIFPQRQTHNLLIFFQQMLHVMVSTIVNYLLLLWWYVMIDILQIRGMKSEHNRHKWWENFKISVLLKWFCADIGILDIYVRFYFLKGFYSNLLQA
jgi:hypothetical protein